jgi:hypothetical protein
MKQWHELVGKRVDTAQIRPFAQVASTARQAKIVRLVRSAMLRGPYVFNVMNEPAVRLE